MTVSSIGRAGGGPEVAQGRLLLVLSGNMLLDALEVSMVLVALPSVARHFELPLSAAHWMQSGFAVGFGCLVLYGTRLAGPFGRRRLYLVALQLFALASLGAAAAPATIWLVVARTVKGGCAALTAPAGLVIIADIFPDGAQRRQALRTYSAFGAAGFSVGAVLSGLLTEASWRYVMVFPAPIALALCWLAARMIPPDATTTPPSWRSVASLPVCLTAAALVVAAAGSRSSTGWLLGAAGVTLLAALAATVERPAARTAARLATRAGFLRSVLGAALLNGSYWSLILVLSLVTQVRGGWPAIGTAGLLLSSSAVVFALALRAPTLIARFGTDRLIIAGWLLTLAGCAGSLLPEVTRTHTVVLACGMLMIGAGFGLSFGSLHVQAMHRTSPLDRHPAGATYQAAVQLGGAMLLAATAGFLPHTGSLPTYPDAGARFVVYCAVVGLLIALTGLRSSPDSS
jgi:MFS family permease